MDPIPLSTTRRFNVRLGETTMCTSTTESSLIHVDEQEYFRARVFLGSSYGLPFRRN